MAGPLPLLSPSPHALRSLQVLTQFDTYTQLINGKDQEVQLASAKLEHQQAVGAQV